MIAAFIFFVFISFFVFRAGDNEMPVHIPNNTKAQKIKKDGGRRIAVIVSNLGHIEENIEYLKGNFSKKVTLGFSPYTKSLTGVTSSLKSEGWNSLILMPMQPANYPLDNLGPYCLLDNIPDVENHSRMEWIMDKISFSEGVYLNTDQIFTLSSDDTMWFLKGMEIKLDELGRKIMMMYYDTNDIHFIEKYYEKLSLSAINLLKIDVAIERNATDQEINQAFGYAELISSSRGLAVVICDSKLNILQQLKKWMGQLDGKGIELISVLE
ncbi:Divergent polysaccharide deacetylase family protein [Candidatus Cyrtobacter comes]|uniref:Divergent polysaccharide deacetylase family protein n=1 Tax=Candidatus Cyrtobacter comes TaxID=675776 RepID=A0ABU5L6L8_9RICK|nr:Divergent polysaccharide deacetylase family protein [Candidatus Cyrtobacter comes]